MNGGSRVEMATRVMDCEDSGQCDTFEIGRASSAWCGREGKSLPLRLEREVPADGGSVDKALRIMVVAVHDM